mmetsp:Transcript_3575/g.2166  ORF Transcript_3575/g.2166 Transcript_3575/m.2166 type:complete len:105 (+) Transcript_3575:218-532(+)
MGGAYPFVDYCPVYVTSGGKSMDCRRESESDEIATNEVFGIFSRCFEVEDVIGVDSRQAGCFETQCLDDGRVTIGFDNGESLECVSGGNVTSGSVTVKCPSDLT